MIIQMSLTIQTSKINDIEVTPVVKNAGEPELKKIKGSDFIPNLYANIFICAKKKSGKTNVIHSLLKNLVNENTKVYIFASTVFKDKTWRTIRKMLDKEDIEFESFVSFIDSEGNSIIPEILSEASANDNEFIDEERKHNKNDPWSQVRFENTVSQQFDSTLRKSRTYDHGFVFGTHELAEKKKKPKYQAPEYIFVFDDLGQELRHNSISQLLKTNRHHKAKVILSSQWVTDLHPQAIKQLDYCFLFRSFNAEKLEKIHELLDLGNTLPEFSTLYNYATSEPYHFLYIDVRNEKYRKDFNEEINVTTENEHSKHRKRAKQN